MKLGDSHNGNSVSLVQRGESLIVNKPRCVFWEHFFLDPDSDFRRHIQSQFSPDLGRILGEIEYVSEDFLSGDAQFVSGYGPVDYNLKEIGELAALAMAFGFGDLHSSNLIYTNTKRFQIIDLECVFNNYNLLQSTLISPAKWNLNNSKTLLGRVLDVQGSKLSWYQAYEFIKAFYTVLQNILDNNIYLINFFESRFKELSSYPIRVLLKPTSYYHNSMGKSFSTTDFLQEEIIQMQRGDIPYFWGYIGNADFYWGEYRSPYKLTSTNAKIESLKLKSFLRPGDLLLKPRLTKIILNVSAEVVKNILDHDSQNCIKDLITVERNGNQNLVQLPELGLKLSYKGDLG